jgi:hypothetical protein
MLSSRSPSHLLTRKFDNEHEFKGGGGAVGFLLIGTAIALVGGALPLFHSYNISDVQFEHSNRLQRKGRLIQRDA